MKGNLHQGLFIIRNAVIQPTRSLLPEQSEKIFTSAEEAASYYLKWDMNLPGNIDGWKVIE